MSKWSHLLNASHIDWVLASVEQHPKVWSAAWDATSSAAWDEIWDAAWNDARGAVRAAARDAAYDATYFATSNVTWLSARVAARDATIALIAYDDCAHLLDMSSEQLKIWAMLSEQPATILLLPAVIARERIAQQNTA